MTAKIAWFGAGVNTMVRERALKVILRMTVALVRDVKKSISTPGPEPSAPGEPPHKQTGHLRSNIQWEVDDAEVAGRVGTSVEYAPWLELGTYKMAPRPYLRPALDRLRSTAQDFIT